MQLSPPKAVVWWISFVLLVASILLTLRIIVVPSLPGQYVPWIAVAGLALMLVATRFSKI